MAISYFLSTAVREHSAQTEWMGIQYNRWYAA